MNQNNGSDPVKLPLPLIIKQEPKREEMKRADRAPIMPGYFVYLGNQWILL